MKNNKRTGNRFKRIAALMLILAMTAVFALVSGCGSESETAADGNAAAFHRQSDGRPNVQQKGASRLRIA